LFACRRGEDLAHVATLAGGRRRRRAEGERLCGCGRGGGA
jgi:hypothetical protein